MEYLGPIASVFSAIVAVGIGLNALLFKWLHSNFLAIYKKLEEHGKAELAHHHQNLRRFEAISIALTKLGADNGRDHHHEST